MIIAEFTHEEVQSLIQSLVTEQDQYLKDFGSNKFSFVREIAERVVEQNNQLIQKLESLIVMGSSRDARKSTHSCFSV